MIRFATDRKVEIGRYHVRALTSLLGRAKGTNPVPVPIQAHFEGLLMSAIACADQVAAGLWTIAGLGTERGGLDQTYGRDPWNELLETDELEQLRTRWFNGPMQDVREVRRRMTHLYYDKSPAGGAFYVDLYEIDPRKFAAGVPIENRELLSFSNTALDLMTELTESGHRALEKLHS